MNCPPDSPSFIQCSKRYGHANLRPPFVEGAAANRAWSLGVFVQVSAMRLEPLDLDLLSY